MALWIPNFSAEFLDHASCFSGNPPPQICSSGRCGSRLLFGVSLVHRFLLHFSEMAPTTDIILTDMYLSFNPAVPFSTSRCVLRFL